MEFGINRSNFDYFYSLKLAKFGLFLQLKIGRIRPKIGRIRPREPVKLMFHKDIYVYNMVRRHVIHECMYGAVLYT